MADTQPILDKINKNIMDEEDIARVVEVLKGGFLSKPEGGPQVVEFEKRMAAEHGKKYALAVNSGTASLHCALTAIGLQEGDEVLVPALANIADPTVVIQVGATPIFVDVSPDDFNIDPKQAELKITSKTRAILVVHMYGQPVQIEKIQKLAAEHNLILIEDCAQAAGARYNGQYVGSFGDISCFSTYQTKHIISGEGGVVLTDNEAYVKIISSFSHNGIKRDDLDAYDYDRLGYNYQMTEIQAVLAARQLEKLDAKNAERRKNVEHYKMLLADLDITFQKGEQNTENSYFYLAGLLPESFIGKRDDFLTLVRRQSAPIKKLYPLALTELTYFKDKVEPDCVVAQNITKRIFNLYVNPGLEDDDIKFIAAAVRNAYEELSD